MGLVQASGSVTIKVNSDVRITEVVQGVSDLDAVCQHEWQIASINLNTRQLVMMPYAHSAHSQAAAQALLLILRIFFLVFLPGLGLVE